MDRTFYITVHRDDGLSGSWEVPEKLFSVYNAFMEALQAANDSVRWHGDPNVGSWNVQPRLLHTGSRKIAAIKLLREFFGWDLLTAKNKADIAPVLLPSIPFSRAEELRHRFAQDDCGEIELPNVLDRIAKAL